MSPKLVKKLADKKYRTETGLFLVEGEKSIHELLSSNYVVETIFGTDTFLHGLDFLLKSYEKRTGFQPVEIIPTKEEELVKMGTLVSNNAGIAVAVQKPPADMDTIERTTKTGFLLALNDVRDPGNLGTIIRTADWFGVTHIVASPTTTDVYNPKTISATMGSFTRVIVSYHELGPLFAHMKELGIPVVGATLQGSNVHFGHLPDHGILLMGSESHGISSELSAHVTQVVTIPKYGEAESLNVSVATGILLDALKRGSSHI